MLRRFSIGIGSVAGGVKNVAVLMAVEAMAVVGSLVRLAEEPLMPVPEISGCSLDLPLFAPVHVVNVGEESVYQ